MYHKIKFEIYSSEFVLYYMYPILYLSIIPLVCKPQVVLDSLRYFASELRSQTASHTTTHIAAVANIPTDLSTTGVAASEV